MRKMVCIFLCVSCLLMVNPGALANVTKDFGNAKVDLGDETADATCPSVNNFLWDLSDEGDDRWMDIEIDCEFRDDYNGLADFNFDITLDVEVWTINPSSFKYDLGFDSWVVDDNSGNWLNVPTVHTDTLSITVPWKNPGSDEKYRCSLHVSIENEEDEVSDHEADSWFITMQR